MVERSLGVRKVVGSIPSREIPSRKKMVPVAPLLTLCIEKRVVGNMAGRSGVSLIMWMLLSSACDRSVPVWQHSNLSHADTVEI